MESNPSHHRRSIRLAGFDYSAAGAYFVTVVTHGRTCIFGRIADEQTMLPKEGQIAEACWQAIPEHFP
jgi:hypothetical protein